MNVPRPLLIVVIVVLVLGVLSCAVGLVRGPERDPEPTQIGLSLPRVPATAIGVGGFNGGNCSRSLSDITVNGGFIGGCQLTIQPDALRPRELVLSVSGGSADVRVRQRVQGRVGESEDTDDVSPGGTIEMTVAGSDELLILIRCTCTLTVIGPPPGGASAAGERG